MKRIILKENIVYYIAIIVAVLSIVIQLLGYSLAASYILCLSAIIGMYYMICEQHKLIKELDSTKKSLEEFKDAFIREFHNREFLEKELTKCQTSATTK